jgi:sensor histidine kinase YesM
MVIDRKVLLRQLRDIILFLFAGVVQTLLMCPGCNTPGEYVHVTIFIFLMWLFLWKGNDYLSDVISERIPWIRFPVKRLVIGIISTTVYSLTVTLALMTFYQVVLDFQFADSYLRTLYIATGITFLISLILHSREFLLHWREAALEREQYEKESISARYESLKNQVNPHFLFNSFNALTNLVYEDQEKAVKFIKQLSEVYRYVLDTRDKETVPLEDEMKFLQSYLYLQKIRFGEKLDITFALDGASMNVAPLALQMLIENAIKHNVVSEDDPLRIKVYVEDGFIVVQNNLQRKGAVGELSAGVGLENICKRYEFLSDRKVEIREDEHHFTVKLPLLSRTTA